MMLDDLLRAADYRGAVAILEADPRDDPGKRFMAMELKAFLEDFEGALFELEGVERLLPDRGIAQEFDPVLRRASDWVRRQTDPAAEIRRTSLCDPPSPFASFYDQAMRHHARREFASAKGRLEQARLLLPRVRGVATLVEGSETPFGDLWDADELTGPHLICVRGESLLDIPFASLAMIEFRPPRGFQDVLWKPARLRTWEGAQADVRVFACYVGSGIDPSPAVRQLRLTRMDHHCGYAVGHGQRDWHCAAPDDPTRISLIGIGRIARIDFRK